MEVGVRVPEAVRITTSDRAKFLGQLDRFGTVAAGKQADLVVIDGNPAASFGFGDATTIVKQGLNREPGIANFALMRTF